MRYWEFGKFTAQHSAWTFAVIAGRSVLEWVSTSNQSDVTEYNDANDGMTVKENPYETNSFYQRLLIFVSLAQVRAKLGQIPLIIHADLAVHHNAAAASGSWRLYLHRMLSTWDTWDVSARYRDISAAVTWYMDAYAPYRGQDYRTIPEHDDGAQSVSIGNPPAEFVPLNITAALSDALADASDLRLMLRNYGTATCVVNFGNLQSNYPHFRIWYLYPVEFYPSRSDGSIDLSETISDGVDEAIYLGAVERGETGVSTRCWLRNYSALAAHFELLDDHPEYIDPQQIAGTGTGALDFVDLVDSAVSQRYVIQFYSSTQYEVQALGWADNVTSLHPTINADATWRGSVSATFTAPSGGLVIPAAAWQAAGILNGDEFEVNVRGNSTSADYPADSNRQVELARDDGAGNPVTATWRPIAGRRERTRAQVTIGASSVFIPTRRVRPADWPTGTKAFVMDAANIDEGQVASVQEAALDSPTFTGSGINDLAVSGNYNGTADRTYRVRISADGASFDWSNDNGSTWPATGVAITGAAQLLEYGVHITLPTGSGYNQNDYWTFTAATWGVTLSGLTATSHVYAAGARIGTTLPLRAVAAAVYSLTTADAGVSESPPSRVYLEDVTGFAAGQIVYVSDLDGTVGERAEVDAVGANYIDLTLGLAYDYPAGALVNVESVGSVAFHLRPKALISTTEELKRVHLNARF